MSLDDVSKVLHRSLLRAARDPALMSAASALVNNDVAVAEQVLKAYLHDHPFEVAAIRMLAEVAARIGRYGSAETLLRRCLELEPGFHRARLNLADVLLKEGKFPEARGQIEPLFSWDPQDPHVLALKAAICARLGDYEDSIGAYQAVLHKFPDQAQLWVGLGHVMKTVGRQGDCIAAYRRATQIGNFGDAWWSLANLKTVELSSDDIVSMQSGISTARSAEDRYHLHFALGKAFEDLGAHAASFAHYAEGNALRRKELLYDRALTTRRLASMRSVFDAPALRGRRDAGCAASDPIFIVGLPRSGSTLIEQILSSHSRVEGTMELPDILLLTEGLAGGAPPERNEPAPRSYTSALLSLDPAGLRRLGERYLERTRRHRKLDRPHFTDKLPNNFEHIGFIHLILPNARIIDARRDPMATCFSCFKQHFSRGQEFTYDLTDLGHYYRDYVEVMQHFDDIAPGLVHRVVYERLIDDPETQVRSMLAYLGLPYEQSCLDFHSNPRAVRTASSEQVRLPLHRDSLDQWRHYEPFLNDLKIALGTALYHY